MLLKALFVVSVARMSGRVPPSSSSGLPFVQIITRRKHFVGNQSKAGMKVRSP